MQVDVAILGAGPAGCAVARCLDPRLRAVLLDPGVVRRSLGETLPPGSRPLLERLGVWRGFLEQGHAPAHGTCAAWGSATLQDHPFLYHPLGEGWHLDRPAFDHLLRAGLPVIDGRARVHVDGGIRLSCAGEHVHARFVVDATGRSGLVGRALGVQTVAFDHGVARFSRYRGRYADSTTWTEAVADGWCMSTVLPDGDLVVAGYADPDAPAAAGPHTRARIGASELVDSWTCSASSQAAEQVFGPGWLTVGDAALATDPLSSQGVSQALATGIAAAEAIGAALAGDPQALARYSREVARLRAAYLAERRRVYRAETRWVERPFWRARHERIRLAPDAHLVRAGDPTRGLYLPLSELQNLARICEPPRPAHEVVRRFQDAHRSQARPDHTVVLALQGLTDSGVLTAA